MPKQSQCYGIASSGFALLAMTESNMTAGFVIFYCNSFDSNDSVYKLFSNRRERGEEIKFWVKTKTKQEEGRGRREEILTTEAQKTQRKTQRRILCVGKDIRQERWRGRREENTGEMLFYVLEKKERFLSFLCESLRIRKSLSIRLASYLARAWNS